ncbi:universal stress protein [Emticicia sp. ODNR4P]|jgi:nucleotide-binding universal stress UspA family protein|nr:universal stress protein [Emticicia sp. ODNR4P]
MKSVIVPTDFSDTAKKALVFASTVAQNLNLDLVLLHVFNLTGSLPYESPSQIEQEIYEAQKASDKQLAILKNQCLAEFKNEVKLLSIYGVISEVIEQVSEQVKADFIVMGTRGAKDIWSNIMGSNTYQVVKNSICPVFVIPDTAHIQDMKNIIYASDYTNNEVKIVRNIVDIADRFKAKTNILHIHDVEEPNLADDETLGDWLLTFFENENIESHITLGSNAIEGIENYLQKNQGDLLVLAMKDRAFFDNLFHTSVTKHFIQDFNMPLLVLPK